MFTGQRGNFNTQIKHLMKPHLWNIPSRSMCVRIWNVILVKCLQSKYYLVTLATELHRNLIYIRSGSFLIYFICYVTCLSPLRACFTQSLVSCPIKHQSRRRSADNFYVMLTEGCWHRPSLHKYGDVKSSFYCPINLFLQIIFLKLLAEKRKDRQKRQILLCFLRLCSNCRA